MKDYKPSLLQVGARYKLGELKSNTTCETGLGTNPFRDRHNQIFEVVNELGFSGTQSEDRPHLHYHVRFEVDSHDYIVCNRWAIPARFKHFRLKKEATLCL